MAQFNRGNFSRADRFGRLGDNSRLATNRNGFGRQNGTIANRRSNGSQLRNGNNLPQNWRDHVVARHGGNWHRDWDRGRDHRWHGHHCRFINGSWVIFDYGFYPWWSYGYPSGYYGYDYYPSDADYYSEPQIYGDGGGDVDEYGDSTVAAAQERLAQSGYYGGEVDGIYGPETRRGVLRYQRARELRATGTLTTGTLAALGLQKVASY